MARALTAPQRALLNSPHLRAVALITFFLDSGTYRFCDDVEDMTDGTNTYVGASGVAEFSDIRSGADLTAEPVTITVDGNRFTQAGVDDPAKILRQMLDELHHQRRVDIALGFAYSYSQEINLVVPVYAGKINSCRMIDPDMDMNPDSQPVAAKIEIVLDSLAMRYTRATFRIRSDADQREIDPNDSFFSFTEDAANTNKSIYWGKKGPQANINDASEIARQAAARMWTRNIQ